MTALGVPLDQRSELLRNMMEQQEARARAREEAAQLGLPTRDEVDGDEEHVDGPMIERQPDHIRELARKTGKRNCDQFFGSRSRPEGPDSGTDEEEGDGTKLDFGILHPNRTSTKLNTMQKKKEAKEAKEKARTRYKS
jgi:hypothetical protein